MKIVIPKGSTSRIITVFIQDNSVTTGAGLGSLDQTSGIVGGYVREGGTGVALAVDENVTTEGTYQAPSAVGKVRIGTPANSRSGTYELHFHNDLWLTGAETVTITLGGAANMADIALEVQLSDPVRGLGAPTAVDSAQVELTRILDRVDYQRGHHTVAGSTFYVDGETGNDANPGTRASPKLTITGALALCTSNAHDEVILLPNAAGGPTTITESAAISVTKNYVQIRGPGRDVLVTRSNNGDVFSLAANGVGLSGFRIATFGGAGSACIRAAASADFIMLHRMWIEDAHQDGVFLTASANARIEDCIISDAVRDGIRLNSGAGSGFFNRIERCEIRAAGGSGINLIGADASNTHVVGNMVHDCGVAGVTIGASVADTEITDNRFSNNVADIVDGGTGTVQQWNFLSTTLVGGVTLADGVTHGGSTALMQMGGGVAFDGLVVTGTTTISDLTVSAGSMALNAGMSISGLTVNGNTTLNNLTVNDAVAFNSTFDIAGIITANNAGNDINVGTTSGVKLADGVTHGGTTAMLRLGAVGAMPGLFVTGLTTAPAVRFQTASGTYDYYCDFAKYMAASTGRAFHFHASPDSGTNVAEIYGAQGSTTDTLTFSLGGIGNRSGTYGNWGLGSGNSTGGLGAYFGGRNAAGTMVEQVKFGTSDTALGGSIGSIVLAHFESGVYSLGDMRGDGLELASLLVSGATTLIGAVTATNVTNDIRGVKLAADGVDLVMPVTGANAMNLRQAINILLAPVAGKSTGAGTATETFYDVGDGVTARLVGTNTAGAEAGTFNRTGVAFTIPA